MLSNFSITDRYVNEFTAKMEKPGVFFSNIWQKIDVFEKIADLDDTRDNKTAQKSDFSNTCKTQQKRVEKGVPS